MVIAAALSIQDPRERPADKQTQADQQHARFRDETSDFLAFLNLWRYIREQQKERGSSAFRRMCKQEYLNFLRIREWQDIYTQLRTVAKQMGIHLNEDDAAEQSVHVSLLAGLLSHVGMKDVKETGGESGRSTGKNEYLGARNAKFAIFPGSALFKKPPRFVMSAELVETSRLWARVNARIEPEWVEPLAEHLLKRTYSEPHWEKDQAAVMAYEKVTLYGVPIVAQVLRRQPQAPDRGRGAGASCPPTGHPGRRRDAVRLLRPAGAGPRRVRRALRLLVEAQAPRRARTPRLRALDAHQRASR
jgi:ATP-dependent helicase HrpA